jgi:acid phosphatase family membrane protein YuiD
MPVEPGATNTYVPSWDATGQIVAYVRNPKKFRINSYVAYRPANKMVGLYMVYDKDNPARVVSEEEFNWPDGAVRPEGNNNLDGFDLKEYRTFRKDIPFSVGNLTRQQATWDIVAAQAAGRMMQYMTLTTWNVVKFLETAANWPASHVATADALSGGFGFWDTSDTNLNAIQKTIYAAVEQIMLDTNAMVSMDELRMVIGVQAARKIRYAKEVLDYIKQSPMALAQVRGELPNQNVEFGLPAKLFGMDLIVENAVRVSSRKNAAGTSTKAFIKDPNTAVILSKQDGLPGDQVGDFPTPNFSTFQVFYYTGDGNKNEEKSGGPSGLYTVETFEDTRNKRLDGHVVTNFGDKMVAGESGFLITNILSA